jgi:hypothetical protein
MCSTDFAMTCAAHEIPCTFSASATAFLVGLQSEVSATKFAQSNTVSVPIR